nr:Ubiquitin carboxyl-terminal hydrolase 13 [Ipomoea batatas]
MLWLNTLTRRSAFVQVSLKMETLFAFRSLFTVKAVSNAVSLMFLHFWTTCIIGRLFAFVLWRNLRRTSSVLNCQSRITTMKWLKV